MSSTTGVSRSPSGVSSARRTPAYTSQPAAAIRSAAARPMPRPAPVISTEGTTLVRDQPFAGELVARLVQRDVAGRQDDVRLDQLVAVERVAVALDHREHLAPDLLEAPLVARLDGLDGRVVELVELVLILVGDPEL